MRGKVKSLLALVLLLPIFIFVTWYYVHLPEKISGTHVTVILPKGSALTQIADSLQTKGLIEQSKLFVFWAKTLGYETELKAGMFQVPQGLNYPQLAAFLAESKPVELSVTLIEGWPSGVITKTLSKELGLDRQVLDSLVVDFSFCKELGVDADNLTGYLLPNTYMFAFGITEKQVLSYLVRKTHNLFNVDSVGKQLAVIGYSQHQILTLSSIVEGEAMVDEERRRIASVYWNRLKRNMRLQADPTIQFILKDGPRRLLYKDLEIDSPYNTYRYAGLPPGPINNPGAASILATIFPEQTKFIYFVAKGDGYHVFSRSAADHARAKAAFNKVRREVARKKRYQKGN